MKNDKSNFKLSFTDNTSFAGIDAEGFYAAALLTGKSVSTFRLIPNVKSKIKLGLLDLGNILGDADCTFTGSGEGALSQKSFEVTPLKINLEYCKRTFETDYLSALLKPGSNSAEVMPTSVETYLLDRVAKHVAQDIEKMSWMGDIGATSGAFFGYPYQSADGLVKKALADATVIDVVATTLTAGNVVAEIQKVYNAIPATIISKEDTVIYIGSAGFRNYKTALATASLETNFMQAYNELFFLGIPVLEAPGLGPDLMFASIKSNLLLLTDLISDFEDVKVLPQGDVTGVPVVRMVGEFKYGVGFIIGSEVVLYA